MKMNPISECKDTKFPEKQKASDSGIDLNLFFRRTSLAVEGWDDTTDGSSVCLYVSAIGNEAPCPYCGQMSGRVHSRYIRHLMDLPAFGKEILIRFHARKFFCGNLDCRRRTFAEQPGNEIFRYRRRTRRCEVAVHRQGLCVSSIQASALLKGMGIAVSKSTVLRDLHRMRMPIGCDVRRIGIDDWAFRKGKDFGSVIVDLATGKPLDLLPGRTERDFSEWLSDHKRVWLMSRDRATSYSSAAVSCGSPVTEIADRFHLIKNLRECVSDTICSRYGDIARYVGADASTGKESTGGRAESLYDELSRSVRKLMEEGKGISETMSLLGVGKKFVKRHRELDASGESDTRPAHPGGTRKKGYVYEGLFNEVKRLQREGKEAAETSALVGLSRHTVEKYRAMESYPAPRRKFLGAAAPYAEFVEQQYVRGVSLEEIYRTLKSRGLRLGRTNFYNHFKYLSDGHRGYRPAVQKARMEEDWQKGLSNIPFKPRPILPPVRQLANTVMKRVLEKDLTVPEEDLLETLGRLDWFSELLEAAVTFRNNLGSGCPSRLNAWVSKYRGSGTDRIRKFVNGIKRDIVAVRNAILFKESNGITEGYVNKLKTIKRSMYGRAKLDLLKVKMIMASLAFN